MPDKWAQYAVPAAGADKWAQYAQPETVAGAGPMGTPQPATPRVTLKPSLLGADAAPSVATDLARGAVKGAGHTANNIGKMLVPDALVRATGATPPSAAQQAATFTPTNTAQKIGYGGEQAAEFLAPGGAEEAGMAKLAPYVGKAAPLLKAGLAAVGSGAVNKAQGGSFGGGAVAGAIGSGVGQGLAALAPAVAESAIGVRKLDRAYGRTPGQAILKETTGLTPEAVADSAQGVLNKINPELERVVRTNAIAPVEMSAPRGVIQSAQGTAATRNAPTSYKQLQPMMDQLNTNFSTGVPIPAQVSPAEALNLKRGFGEEFIHNWNPETMGGTKSTAAKAYRALADEIHTTAPGSAELDERASSLIPVAKRAESVARNAPSTQQMLHRLAVPTGAMAAPLGMGAYGYEKGGVMGAAKGFAEGMAIPLLAASPTGQMALARGLNSRALQRLVVPGARGGLLQFGRSTDSDPQQ